MASRFLVLSPRCLATLPDILKAVNSDCRRLYVCVDPSLSLSDTLDVVYAHASAYAPLLDVRVLLKGGLNKDSLPLREMDNRDDARAPILHQKYGRACLGGTFDRLHNGHKVLLSRAAMMVKESLVCGVTLPSMNKRKKLWEMIEPIGKRTAAVQDFVNDVSKVKCEVFEIADPFGPSVTMPELEAIIVSDETEKGGIAVNAEREKRGMRPLVMDKIKLIEGVDNLMQETKLSSSSKRGEALGTLLRPVNSQPRFRPYTIGLTGGIASGKSAVAGDLRGMKYEVIDCDKVAHSVYTPGSPLALKIAEAFPTVMKDGSVDRKALGAIIFNDAEHRKRLNGLVWPAVMDAVEKMLNEGCSSRVVFVEAAALVEAGWHEALHETWTVFCGRDEEVQRVMKRDNMTLAEAEARLHSQTDNGARLAVSHVALCSDWARELTRQQVEKAVKLLEERRLLA